MIERGLDASNVTADKGKVTISWGNAPTDAQKDMQLFLKKVLNYRKSSDAIHNGKTIHFAPFLGTYFLFRVTEEETFVHIINKNEEPITIDLNRYEEVGLNRKTLKNIITNETFVWDRSNNVMVFDDSFLHSAKNEGDQVRVVLICDVWNPHLTESERSALTKFMRIFDLWNQRIGKLANLDSQLHKR